MLVTCQQKLPRVSQILEAFTSEGVLPNLLDGEGIGAHDAQRLATVRGQLDEQGPAIRRVGRSPEIPM